MNHTKAQTIPGDTAIHLGNEELYREIARSASARAQAGFIYQGGQVVLIGFTLHVVAKRVGEAMPL